MRCVLCGLCLCPFVFVARGTFLVCAFTGATGAAVARGCGPFVKTRTSGELQAATGCESGISQFPRGKKNRTGPGPNWAGKWGAGFSRCSTSAYSFRVVRRTQWVKVAVMHSANSQIVVISRGAASLLRMLFLAGDASLTVRFVRSEREKVTAMAV